MDCKEHSEEEHVAFPIIPTSEDDVNSKKIPPKIELHHDEQNEVQQNTQPSKDLPQKFQQTQDTINILNQNLSRLKVENIQLKKDIQTLIEFKNELEVLAEDQNRQILDLNNTLLQFTEELKRKDDRIEYLQDNHREKDLEIAELNKDVRHLMEERTNIKK